MNEKLPKPMLDALAGGARPAEHPSADVLTAFAERGLAERESTAVTEHLARCGECREVVFLASSAPEEPVSQEEELLVAAAHGPQVWAATAATVAPAAGGPDRSSAPRRRSRWTPRLAWALSLSAVALLVSGLFVTQRIPKTAPAPELTAKVAEEAPMQPQEREYEPAPPPPSGTMSAVVAAKPSAAGAARAKKDSGAASPAVADTKGADALTAESRGLDATAEALRRPNEEGTVTLSERIANAAPPAPRASGFVAPKGEAAGQASAMDSVGVALQKASPLTLHLSPAGWRITEQGHLEHQTSEGWTRVLAEETHAFRVVSVKGNQVWAGGDGGALFHSSDGGAHWSKVGLSGASGSETEAIVTIRFSDAQHGLVITKGGQIYSTSDGGVSWTKP